MNIPTENNLPINMDKRLQNNQQCSLLTRNNETILMQGLVKPPYVQNVHSKIFTYFSMINVKYIFHVKVMP